MVITIPGKPVGKARPRFRRSGFKVITYTPDESKNTKRKLRGFINKAQVFFIQRYL